MLQVYQVEGSHGKSDYLVKQECSQEEESQGLLKTIYENGKFFNQTTLTKIRSYLK
jgi:hypothetical protein